MSSSVCVAYVCVCCRKSHDTFNAYFPSRFSFRSPFPISPSIPLPFPLSPPTAPLLPPFCFPPLAPPYSTFPYTTPSFPVTTSFALGYFSYTRSSHSKMFNTKHIQFIMRHGGTWCTINSMAANKKIEVYVLCSWRISMARHPWPLHVNYISRSAKCSFRSRARFLIILSDDRDPLEREGPYSSKDKKWYEKFQ